MTETLKPAREVVDQSMVDATMQRLEAQYVAAGYAPIIVARDGPDGQWEVIALPYKEDDTPQRRKEIEAEALALIQQGFKVGRGGDQISATAIRSAQIDPSSVSFGKKPG